MYIFTRTKNKKHNRRKTAKLRAGMKAKNAKRRATLLK